MRTLLISSADRNLGGGAREYGGGEDPVHLLRPARQHRPHLDSLCLGGRGPERPVVLGNPLAVRSRCPRVHASAAARHTEVDRETALYYSLTVCCLDHERLRQLGADDA